MKINNWLEGHWALILGASSGFGGEVSEKLSEYGVNIIEWPKIVESYNVKYIKFNFSYFDNFKRRNLIISSNYKNKIIDEFK